VPVPLFNVRCQYYGHKSNEFMKPVMSILPLAIKYTNIIALQICDVGAKLESPITCLEVLYVIDL
jgi:hypothetical protein